MDLDRAIEQFCEENKIYRFEGRQGVVALCRILQAIGYKDPYSSGTLDRGAALGDLLLFLEDNSGALEAIVNWIGEQNVTDWRDNMMGHITVEDEDDEENG